MASEPPGNPTVEGSDISRRLFLKAGLGVVGACYAAALGYPIYRYLADSSEKAEALEAVKEVTLDKADALPANSARTFLFGGRPGLLIHHADGTWSAFSAICTHLACTVQFEADKARIHCACHGGVYDPRTGKNISGPPPRPLAPFAVEVLEGKVVIRRA